MPKKVHDRLEKQARKKGITGDRKKAYVFGTLHKLEQEKTSKRKK